MDSEFLSFIPLVYFITFREVSCETGGITVRVGVFGMNSSLQTNSSSQMVLHCGKYESVKDK